MKEKKEFQSKKKKKEGDFARKRITWLICLPSPGSTCGRLPWKHTPGGTNNMSLKTLILPIVGVENLAQYSVQRAIDERDNLVKHHVDSDFVYPFTIGDLSVQEALDDSGTVAGNRNEYGTGWEHYVSTDKDDTDIMQLHAPIIAGCESLFAKQFSQIVAEHGYKKIVLIDTVEFVPAELEEASSETPLIQLIRESLPDGIFVDHVVEKVTEMEAKTAVFDSL